MSVDVELRVHKDGDNVGVAPRHSKRMCDAIAHEIDFVAKEACILEFNEAAEQLFGIKHLILQEGSNVLKVTQTWEPRAGYQFFTYP